MKIVEKFVLNYDTVLFYPYYDDFGKLMTVVIGNSEPFLVDMPPSALIDYNLKYYGSSLQGATDGSKMVLGQTHVNPVVLNQMVGLYWFPSKSSSREDCVWFALHHVKDYEGLKKGHTNVEFTDESSLELDISFYSFEKKVQRAYQLKGKVEGRTKALATLTEGYELGYHLNKETLIHAYEINPSKRNQLVKK